VITDAEFQAIITSWMAPVFLRSLAQAVLGRPLTDGEATQVLDRVQRGAWPSPRDLYFNVPPRPK
jgi:hypothetical protein